jgi:hypothetical protein
MGPPIRSFEHPLLGSISSSPHKQSKRRCSRVSSNSNKRFFNYQPGIPKIHQKCSQNPQFQSTAHNHDPKKPKTKAKNQFLKRSTEKGRSNPSFFIKKGRKGNLPAMT